MKAKLDEVRGGSKPCQVVLDHVDLAAIDAWRVTQPGIPPRGSAIRHFFRRGMAEWTSAQASSNAAA